MTQLVPFLDGAQRAHFLREAVRGDMSLPFVYCYPPRTAHRFPEHPVDLKQVWIDDRLSGRDLNIYIHIPFCRYRCAFCGLYTITARRSDDEIFEAYVSRVIADFGDLAPALAGRRVRTVFIGGGTPLSIGVARLVHLLSALAEVFPDWRVTVEEVSVEASPDSIMSVARELPALVEAGVTRVSVGVQSYDPGELRSSARSAAGPDVIAASLTALRNAGIGNIGTDLILGLDGQTEDSFDASIEKLLSFRPDTVSLYMLNPRGPSAQGERGWMHAARNGELYQRMRSGSRKLQACGYVRETSAQFKLPETGGLLQKKLYFDGVSVLGLGSGARSYTATLDYLTGGGPQHTRAELEDYLFGTEPNAHAIRCVEITADERARKAVILSLHALALDTIPTGDDGELREPFRSVLAQAVELGLITRSQTGFALTEEGFIYRDLICWSLFSDEVLAMHGATASDYPDHHRFPGLTPKAAAA